MFHTTHFTKSTNSDMFRHQNAIFREFMNTVEYKFLFPRKVSIALLVILEILEYFSFNVALCLWNDH
jgi:hypothetical protein